ncbi:uncharacterized protein TNCV_641381 [Trichonephila clavipes]|nr:uncharacterized protein TNCV_641381 [Trichonephila clavipes]
MLRPVVPKDIIHTKTRLRTPLKDQSLRRPAHRKKRMREVNCFVSCHQDTSSTFTRGPGVFSNHTKAPGRRKFGIEAPMTPTDRGQRLDWCQTRGNWTAAEWSLVVFSDEFRFNLSSDDNRVRVW